MLCINSYWTIHRCVKIIYTTMMWTGSFSLRIARGPSSVIALCFIIYNLIFVCCYNFDMTWFRDCWMINIFRIDNTIYLTVSCDCCTVTSWNWCWCRLWSRFWCSFWDWNGCCSLCCLFCIRSCLVFLFTCGVTRTAIRK